MVDREDAIVLDQQAIARKIWACGGVEVAMRGRRGTNDARRCCLCRKPNHGALPIVTVAEAARGRVFRPVPSIHDSEVPVVRPAASIDLASTAATTFV